MAYRLDPYDNSLVFDGFEQGIADSPYAGIADMRNVNIISIKGEASVNFSTQQVSPTVSFTGTITAVNTVTSTITFTGGSIETGQAVSFSGSLPAPLVANTTYWILSTGANTFQLYNTYSMNTTVVLTTTTTGGTFTPYMVGNNGAFSAPKFFAQDNSNNYFMLDGLGQLWSNSKTTASGLWTFCGTSGTADVNVARGLVFYQSYSTAKRFMFVFKDQSIDYFDLVNFTWVFGWKPSTGTINQVGYLKATGIHNAITGPDNKVYYCDGRYIGRFYQADPNVDFNPQSTATYIFDQTPVVPATDVAQCLTPLGNSILVGGGKNIIYPWDTFSQLPSYPIFIAESNISAMITINTNVFIFSGSRGRIYVTNGSQAQLFKKIPDHISGTVEPTYTWGGVTSNKNQLYIGFSVTTNATTTPITQYGGVWGIDIDSRAIRLVNKLSYGTYAGSAPALLATSTTSNPFGTGILIGWDNGSFVYGIDQTVSTLYTGSQASITFDLVPVGTFDKPMDFQRVEYRLTRPLVSGESITIYARQIFNTQDTGFGSAILTDSTVGNFSNSAPVNFKNAQWLQLQVVLNSTATNPSYVRLKEIRIKRQ